MWHFIWRCPFPHRGIPSHHPICRCSFGFPWFSYDLGYPHDYGNPHIIPISLQKLVCGRSSHWPLALFGLHTKVSMESAAPCHQPWPWVSENQISPAPAVLSLWHPQCTVAHRSRRKILWKKLLCPSWCPGKTQIIDPTSKLSWLHYKRAASKSANCFYWLHIVAIAIQIMYCNDTFSIGFFFEPQCYCENQHS